MATITLHTGQHLQGCVSCYKFNDLQTQIEAAAEVYKSGQTASKPALAKVKKLIKQKVFSLELQRSLALDEDAIPACP